MKFQIFSEKNKKNINLSSAELAQREEVMVNGLVKYLSFIEKILCVKISHQTITIKPILLLILNPPILPDLS